MNHLLRGHAPITDTGWADVDTEARERLVANLAARKVVDFDGPEGWTRSAVNLGRTRPLEGGPVEGVVSSLRRVLPLAELRAPFTVDRSELLDADRGAVDVDYASLDAAALRIATAENVAVFHGWEAAGIEGIAGATPHPVVPLGPDVEGWTRLVAGAVELLRVSGVDGPYALVLGPAQHTAVVETAEHGGYPLFDHLRKIVEGPVVRAPGVRGGAVLSLRGGDFLFASGQDLSVGYEHHDHETVHLYLEESFTFRVATPEAAVALGVG
jgi:uncharacterized linocin/CFP29 family protein